MRFPQSVQPLMFSIYISKGPPAFAGGLLRFFPRLALLCQLNSLFAGQVLNG